MSDEDGQQQVLFESHAIAKFVCKLGEGGSDLLGSTPLMQASRQRKMQHSCRWQAFPKKVFVYPPATIASDGLHGIAKPLCVSLVHGEELFYEQLHIR